MNNIKIIIGIRHHLLYILNHVVRRQDLTQFDDFNELNNSVVNQRVGFKCQLLKKQTQTFSIPRTVTLLKRRKSEIRFRPGRIRTSLCQMGQNKLLCSNQEETQSQRLEEETDSNRPVGLCQTRRVCCYHGPKWLREDIPT